MRWRKAFKSSLGGKFLLSYLLIVLVGVGTLLVVVFALAPTLFQAQLLPILQTHPADPVAKLLENGYVEFVRGA
jgi:hypothetical protein